MEIFMDNNCGHGNCMSTECKKCPYYSPAIAFISSNPNRPGLGLGVPRWIGNILYKIEGWLLLYKK